MAANSSVPQPPQPNALLHITIARKAPSPSIVNPERPPRRLTPRHHRSRLPPAALRLLLLAVGFTFVGCHSLPHRMAEASAELETQTTAEITRLRDVPTRLLTWDDALARLETDNLTLRESQHGIARAEENFRRIYLDLLPALSLTGSLSRALTDLGNLSSDDFNLNVFGLVSVPGLINLRTRHYSTSLEILRAHWSHQLRLREQTADLYRTFIRADALRLRRLNLERSQLWSAALPRQTLDADPEVLSREAQLFSIRQEEDALQDKLAELLGGYEFAWQPDPSSLPPLDYLASPLPPDDLDRNGLLVRRLQATEIEGARLRELGVKLQYWPDLSFTLNSPPLLQVSRGTTTTWNPDQIFLNANSNVRLDTQLRVAYQLRDVRRSITLMRERLALEVTRAVQRQFTAAQTLEFTARELRLVELRLATLEDAPRGLNVDAWRDQLQKLILLSERRASLLQQKAALDTYFWVLDESRWPDLAPPLPDPS